MAMIYTCAKFHASTYKPTILTYFSHICWTSWVMERLQLKDRQTKDWSIRFEESYKNNKTMLCLCQKKKKNNNGLITEVG